MKRILIGCTALLMLTGSAAAQGNGIDAILQQIASNNKELKAQNHLLSSQKLENKATNNLSDPTLSYSHVWDSTNSGETAGELIVSQ
ncbi:MAG: TolC family protein, partial [Bacteroides sp.]